VDSVEIATVNGFYWVVNSMMGLYGTIYWKKKLYRLNKKEKEKNMKNDIINYK